MLAVRRDVVTTSLAPIVATLRDVEVRHGSAAVHGLVPGLVPEDTTGWIRATELIPAAPDGGQRTPLDDLLDAAKQRWTAQPHAAAALAWKCYTYWLTLPALVGYATVRRVPLPRLDDILV